MSKVTYVLIIKDFTGAGRDFKTPIENWGKTGMPSGGLGNSGGNFSVFRKPDKFSHLFASIAYNISSDYQGELGPRGKLLSQAAITTDFFRIKGRDIVTDRHTITFLKLWIISFYNGSPFEKIDFVYEKSNQSTEISIPGLLTSMLP